MYIFSNSRLFIWSGGVVVVVVVINIEDLQPYSPNGNKQKMKIKET